MRIKRSWKFLGIGLALVVLALAIGSQGQIALGQGQPQPPCTVAVTPSQSIQEAIDKASPGDVICLGEGEWTENLTIEKSITLRGVGMDKTVIRGKQKGKSVTIVNSDSEIEVTIEGLTVTGAEGPAGIMIDGKAKVIIRASQISENSWDGIRMEGSSQATIRGNRFLDNRYFGILVVSEEASVRGGPNEMRRNGADLGGYAPASLRKPLVSQTDGKRLSVPGDYPSIQEAIDAIAPGGTITVASGTYEVGLTIWKPLALRGAGKDKTVLKPLPSRELIVSITSEAKGVALERLAVTGSEGDGLLVYGETSLNELQISGNGEGIVMEGSSQATISDSEISGNDDDGISMWESSQATISDSKISGNGYGVEIGGAAQATISGSEISGSGDEGIWMEDSAQATIRKSKIFGNGDYSVALWQRPCFDTDSKFKGMEDSSQATISGSEVTDNDNGIRMEDSSRATISGSEISGNYGGIWMRNSSRATISGSEISGNDNGILMRDSSQATIRGSRFLDNRYFGIWVESKKASVRGGPNEMRGNGTDLGGYAPASLRQPLTPQSDKKALSVPGDYPSIQEAIDAIAPGGTITVAPGTYEVGLTIWKPLTLRGAGKDKTVLKPLSNPTRKLIVSITSQAKEVAIEGLSVTGSKGSGLLIYSEASLKGLQISGNGGGIGMGGSSKATISGSEISGNRTAGIAMVGSSQATISRSEISGNEEDGIFMWNSAQATIRKSKIFKNKGYGVVIYLDRCGFEYGEESFAGKVEGSGNEIHDNDKGDICPAELQFLMTKKGGCYGPECAEAG